MFNLNKALLSIIISALAVQTTQPMDFNWLTNSSIYKQGTELCSRLSKTDAYKKYSPYSNWLLKKATEHKYTIATCVICLFIARQVHSIYEHRKYIDKLNNKIKEILNNNPVNKDKLEQIPGYVRYGANVNTRSDERATPLYVAVTQEYWQMVELLLKEHKADPNIKTNNGDSAVDAAEHVQNIEAKARIIDIFNGNTGHYSELQGNRKSFEEALTRINESESDNVSDDDWATIKYLIGQRKVEVDHFVNYSKNREGYSALYLAIKKESLEMVNWLIEQGTNVKRFPWRYDSKPIIFAAQKRNHVIFNALVKGGADRNTTEHIGIDLNPYKDGGDIRGCGSRAIDILNGKTDEPQEFQLGEIEEI